MLPVTCKLLSVRLAKSLNFSCPPSLTLLAQRVSSFSLIDSTSHFRHSGALRISSRSLTFSGTLYFLFQRPPLETPFQAFGTRFLSSFSLRWSLRRNFSFPPQHCHIDCPSKVDSLQIDLFLVLEKEVSLYIFHFFLPFSFQLLRSLTCLSCDHHRSKVGGHLENSIFAAVLSVVGARRPEF